MRRIEPLAEIKKLGDMLRESWLYDDLQLQMSLSQLWEE